MMKSLYSGHGGWLKYFLPINTIKETGVFTLTPWCFYMHGIHGKFEIPKHMYTSFTLVLKLGERLVVVPDQRFHEMFVNGKLSENGTEKLRIIGKKRNMVDTSIRMNLIENNQIILIRDSFFEQKIDVTINMPIIECAMIRSLFSDLFDHDVNVEVTETLHAIANIIFILTAQKKAGEKKTTPLELVINAIIGNYKEKNFNLDKLSSIVLMSRRKVQYILSESGETFSSLIHECRVDEMKRLIRENPRIRLSELAEHVGMNNSHTASKAFYKSEGVSVKEYKESCKAGAK